MPGSSGVIYPVHAVPYTPAKHFTKAAAEDAPGRMCPESAPMAA
jgi:hypothetical protein